MLKSKGEKFWEPLISEWSQSSLGPKEFCKKKDISTQSFHYWKRKFSTEFSEDKKCKTSSPNVSFMEVCEKPTAVPKDTETSKIKAFRTIIIRTSYGCTIEVPL